MSVSKKMLIGEVVRKYPEAAIVMMEAGMHCVGCHVAGMETVEQGCKAHGMKDEQVDELIKKINKQIQAIPTK